MIGHFKSTSNHVLVINEPTGDIKFIKNIHFQNFVTNSGTTTSDVQGSALGHGLGWAEPF